MTPSSRSVGEVAPACVEQFRECVEAMERALAAPDDVDARRLAVVVADQIRDVGICLHTVYRGLPQP